MPSSTSAMWSGSSARVRESPFVCVEQTTGILGRPEEVGGLLPARVLVGQHEDSTAATRDDLNGMVTGADAVNEAGSIRLASSTLTVTATPLVSHGIGVSYRPLRLGWWQELPEPLAVEPRYFTVHA